MIYNVICVKLPRIPDLEFKNPSLVEDEYVLIAEKLILELKLKY